MKNITPNEALQKLKEGNFRFVNNLKLNHDLLEQVNETKDGQTPFAAILSCMDSRTSAELIFNLGLGDIFSIRIAGNIVSEGILGSLEYATAVANAKLIMVLGHTGCGAVKGACDNVELGHVGYLLEKIKPAVDKEKQEHPDRSNSDTAFVNDVSRINVLNSVNEIIARSKIIQQLLQEQKIGIIPAMYDVTTGQVSFYDNEARFDLKK